jgi:hypothetical protein
MLLWIASRHSPLKAFYVMHESRHISTKLGLLSCVAADALQHRTQHLCRICREIALKPDLTVNIRAKLVRRRSQFTDVRVNRRSRRLNLLHSSVDRLLQLSSPLHLLLDIRDSIRRPFFNLRDGKFHLLQLILRPLQRRNPTSTEGQG